MFFKKRFFKVFGVGKRVLLVWKKRISTHSNIHLHWEAAPPNPPLLSQSCKKKRGFYYKKSRLAKSQRRGPHPQIWNCKQNGGFYYKEGVITRISTDAGGRAGGGAGRSALVSRAHTATLHPRNRVPAGRSVRQLVLSLLRDGGGWHSFVGNFGHFRKDHG